MVNELETSEWKESFMQEASDELPEAMWQTFKSKLIDLRNRFVPKREFKIETKKMKGSFPIFRSQ